MSELKLVFYRFRFGCFNVPSCGLGEWNYRVATTDAIKGCLREHVVETEPTIVSHLQPFELEQVDNPPLVWLENARRDANESVEYWLQVRGLLDVALTNAKMVEEAYTAFECVSEAEQQYDSVLSKVDRI